MLEVQISFFPEAHGQATCMNTLLRVHNFIATWALWTKTRRERKENTNLWLKMLGKDLIWQVMPERWRRVQFTRLDNKMVSRRSPWREIIGSGERKKCGVSTVVRVECSQWARHGVWSCVGTALFNSHDTANLIGSICHPFNKKNLSLREAPRLESHSQWWKLDRKVSRTPLYYITSPEVCKELKIGKKVKILKHSNEK